jgi:hypothetical protein
MKFHTHVINSENEFDNITNKFNIGKRSLPFNFPSIVTIMEAQEGNFLCTIPEEMISQYLHMIDENWK